ncbi:MAG: GNAT family N-acetyltransferase [Chloroflexota bacterium]
MIRRTLASDKEALLALLKDSGEFDTAGLMLVEEMMVQYLAGDSDALWFTVDDGEPVGVAYCAPEPMTNGTWNLLMLWMRADRVGKGLGRALVRRVEAKLTELGGRILIVETSGTDGYASSRRFYEKSGFTKEARIRDFYEPGDDKIVYWKKLSTIDAIPDAEIDELYALFAAKKMRRELWTHTAHFVVVTCLLVARPDDTNLDVMRTLIKANNLHMGIENTDTGGYHETLTWFYLHEVKNVLAGAGTLDRYEAVRLVLQSPIVAIDYPGQFYDKRNLFSVEARRSVLQP